MINIVAIKLFIIAALLFIFGATYHAPWSIVGAFIFLLSGYFIYDYGVINDTK